MSTVFNLCLQNLNESLLCTQNQIDVESPESGVERQHFEFEATTSSQIVCCHFLMSVWSASVC
jgi:hypothetical protein